MSSPSDADLARILWLVDLDDTLFQSWKPEIHGEVGEGGRIATVNREGQPYARMKPQQEAAFDLMRRTGRVIPVTARTESSYLRVQLPFSDWAVVSGGSLILRPDGSPEPAWAERVASIFANAATPLNALVDDIQSISDELEVQVHLDRNNAPLYVTARSADRDPVRISQLLAGYRFDGWTIASHRVDWFIAPTGLGKEAAVQWLLDTGIIGAEPLRIGVGDWPSDLAFMRLCHFVMAPSNARIVQALAASAS